MEELKKFLEEIRTNPRANEMINGMEKPESPEELAACYAKIAKELGYTLTEDDILEGVKTIAEDMIAMTEKHKAEMDKLDMDEMNKVAGGLPCHNTFDKCSDTFKDEENCWWNDGCNAARIHYLTYHCSYLYDLGNR